MHCNKQFIYVDLNRYQPFKRHLCEGDPGDSMAT